MLIFVSENETVMTDIIQNSQGKLIELRNLVVDYSDGDIAIFDHLKSFKGLLDQKTMTNIIAICFSGELTISIDGEEKKISANDVFICPPNIRAEQYKVSNDFDCKVLCLSDHVIQGLLHDRIDIWHETIYSNRFKVISMSETCKQEFVNYHGLIYSKIHNHHTVQYDILHVLIRALLLEICKLLPSVQGQSDDEKPTQGKTLFNKFLKLVSSNDIKRRPITYYSNQLAITPKYLTMLCLKYSDKTASDWIVQYTIEDIRFYLRNSNLSIKEVSAKLGFANMSHFGSYVRKNLGMSPSDFRHNR